ncbi:hypothetical protein EVG20_g6427 [Dentipellis fragilis]|uniref:Uncharacterized protein n=1 Tax=Dentipellis fragilis TaxID=205917 RepID=A0A4Y9YL89_9AGAM|nr:hypothetical protein EVG20_g6427 [Dentipellis fragilis]
MTRSSLDHVGFAAVMSSREYSNKSNSKQIGRATPKQPSMGTTDSMRCGGYISLFRNSGITEDDTNTPGTVPLLSFLSDFQTFPKRTVHPLSRQPQLSDMPAGLVYPNGGSKAEKHSDIDESPQLPRMTVIGCEAGVCRSDVGDRARIRSPRGRWIVARSLGVLTSESLRTEAPFLVSFDLQILGNGQADYAEHEGYPSSKLTSRVLETVPIEVPIVTHRWKRTTGKYWRWAYAELRHTCFPRSNLHTFLKEICHATPGEPLRRMDSFGSACFSLINTVLSLDVSDSLALTAGVHLLIILTYTMELGGTMDPFLRHRRCKTRWKSDGRDRHAGLC